MTPVESALFLGILCFTSLVPRFLPFLFSNRLSFLSESRVVNQLVPTLVLFGLVLYCFRELEWSSEYAYKLVAAVFIIFVHLKFQRFALSILSGTGLYLLLMNY